MHNNYYFLRHLSHYLNNHLTGFTIQECFTQSKNELIIGLYENDREFFIKAHLDPTFCCLTFPNSFHRARKNSTDLFRQIIGKKIMQVYQYQNDRCFALLFTDDSLLIFKMYGNRSNVIYYDQGQVVEIFRKSLTKDKDLKPEDLNRPLDQSYDAFCQYQGDHKKIFPTFGKEINHYFETQDLENKSIPEKWALIQKTLSLLDESFFYVIRKNQIPQLSLLPIKGDKTTFSDPLAAINEFYHAFIVEHTLFNLKKQALTKIDKQISQCENYIQKADKRINEIENRYNYSWLADLLMANLHLIPSKVENVTLNNFYNNNIPITIRLKKDLSPQKNAESYYRKAKNQAQEIEKLKQNRQQKWDLAIRLEEEKAKILKESDVRKLQKLVRSPGEKTGPPRPFHLFHYHGFDIYVGRNAKNNDLMLQQFSFKNDLWLHAREVSGSHVLIKYQSGRVFPKDVVEKAAQLAAWNSKRRTESLCPVIVTARKFVRKRKGDPPGAVVVDKEEEILLVRPSANV